MAAKPTHVCPDCGHIAKPKTTIGGSFAVELVLWLLFCAPGLIYSVWRLTTRKPACPACNSGNVIPLDTPRGKQLEAYWANAAASGQLPPMSRP